MAYPVLADQILPVGLKGIFILALFATIMSTLDSYLFISGQTLGRDYLVNYFPDVPPNRLTKISFLISALIGILLDRKSTRLNSSHVAISYAVFCLKKKK